MDKLLCDKCEHEIKHGIRLDGGKPFPRYYRMKVNGYTGEGAGCLNKHYDLCESCYSKLIKFLEEE